MDDVETVRRRVAHELYSRLALLSAAIWMVGTVLLFITYAAGNPRPIPMAAMAMTVPILPAALLWLCYRPLIGYLTARQVARAAPPTPPSLGGSGGQPGAGGQRRPPRGL